MTARGAPREVLLRLGSSFRSRPARDTVRIARALMPSLGISRVVDTTRMDRLGLPVYASVRPRGELLRVHAGKGMRAEEALAGAIMEAIEFAVAEPRATAWEPHRVSLVELEAQFGGALRLVDFAPRFGVKVAPGAVVTAVACEQVGADRPVLLPAELVFLPFVPPEPERVFRWTSTGLASGNSLDEATLHGLLEVLERDALSMNMPKDASQWLDPDELPTPFRELAASWRAIGVALSVRQVPNEFSLPCFEALVHEPESDSVNIAGGSGLHLDREIALSRAICEAAQSRLSHIHGGRDDITAFYAKYAAVDKTARLALEAGTLAKAFDTTRRIAFEAVPHPVGLGASVSAVLDGLLAHLRAVGFPTVFRHRFARELDGLHVVKIVVPRCEDAESATGRIGPRLFARITATANHA